MKRNYLYLLFFTLLSVTAFAQKPHQTPPIEAIDLKKFTPPTVTGQPSVINNQNSTINELNISNETRILNIHLPTGLKIISQRNGLPSMISGNLQTSSAVAATLEARNSNYLDALKTVMHIQLPGDEFVTVKSETDEIGQIHTRLQQQYKGLKVWNGEVILHEENQKIKLMNGNYFSTSKIENIIPTVGALDAQQKVQLHLTNNGGFTDISGNEKSLRQVGGQQFKSELVIYHERNNFSAEHLAWHISAYSNVMHRYEYFVEAQNGAILNFYESSCTFFNPAVVSGSWSIDNTNSVSKKDDCDLNVTTDHPTLTTEMPPLDGPATASANDLPGVARTINTYQTNGTYVMIDASRPMFKPSQSSMPNSPVGVLQTFDNQNNDGGGTFGFVQSSNNNWNDNPTAVSAQYNGSQSYSYYLNTHGRNSINGKGGNVDSYINVAQSGKDMDNAYWNGEAMYYGNGDKYFYPLPRGLDVGGHEISHGVIQNTANLTYQDESGALNESMADVFGSLIDRANWTIGENVIKNTNAFPTGFLRDLSNPHNGGSQLGDGGYQPAIYSEIYQGSKDNGGVHINSGIPNFAYYKFASNPVVGKDKAEKIYYRALVNYLVASSNFIDCRAAIEQCCKDLYPGNADVLAAASNAFAQVGIGSGGSATGASHQTDLPVNNGTDFVLFVGSDDKGIYIQTPGTQPQSITSNGVKSKPSVSDNGTSIVYVGTDTKLYFIAIDWSALTVKEQALSTQTGWNNTAISKDGNKIAANAGDTAMYIFNLKTNTQKVFYIYNPTTAPGDIRTSDVQYSDALEWDLFGEKILYDAYNAPKSNASIDAGYWDISVISVWSNSSGNFGSGKIQKVFTQLPEKTSVGNPTFAKNSPYIIAFDYVETPDPNTTNYYVVSANIQTGEVTQNSNGLVKNTTLGYPNFSVKDDKVLYTTGTTGNYSLRAINVTNTKLEPTGGPVAIASSGQKGAFFTNTSRIISAVRDLDKSAVKISPNPFSQQMQVELNAAEATDGDMILFDLVGRNVMTQKFRTQIGTNTFSLDTRNLSDGMYLMKVRIGSGLLTVPIVKMDK